MTNIRSPVQYDDTEISIEPEEDREFYLTGDTPIFKLRVRDLRGIRRKGRIFLTWHLLDVFTIRPLDIDIPPKGEKVYNLIKEWLHAEGVARYNLRLTGTIEEPKIPDKDIMKTGVHPLCSYLVKDRDWYNYQERQQRTLERFTKISTAFTIVMTFLTVILVCLTYLLWTS